MKEKNIMVEQLILVDRNDQEIGMGEKIEIHKCGKLHRAFSIFIFNSLGELLIQKRAYSKYHSGGLWSNTCCSHPRIGELLEKSTHRRLIEEMGFDCLLKEVFSFIYKIKLTAQLFEYEYDHVFIGKFDGIPSPNSNEVSDWKWIDFQFLINDVSDHPSNYTYWFQKMLRQYNKKIRNRILY
jgi:isopentenyl-diphosphate delta-isomerase